MTVQDAPIHFSELRTKPLNQLRAVLRENRYQGHTAGLGAGLLQCNLVVLPQAFAEDFQAFCDVNPVPCPLIARSKAGSLNFEGIDNEVDISRDLPSYRVFKNGTFTEEVSDVADLWQDDFVTFAIGCSFSFENALAAEGIPLRHIEENKTVPMYRTDLPLVSRGVFQGSMVVSMRPVARENIDTVKTICHRFPHAHGAPVHVGDPAEIGIQDLNKPSWGESVTIGADEDPVFWGCGVTSQVAVVSAKPPIAITHAPGAMLILDLPDRGKK